MIFRSFSLKDVFINDRKREIALTYKYHNIVPNIAKQQQQQLQKIEAKQADRQTDTNTITIYIGWLHRYHRSKQQHIFIV